MSRFSKVPAMEAGSPGAAVTSLRGGHVERGNRILWAPAAIATFSVALMAVVAVAMNLPIHDPDARYVGSSAALIGVVALIFLTIDVARRAWLLHRIEATGPAGAVIVLRERWLNRRGVIVVVTLLSFCATYVAYRNLKSYVPAVTSGNFDSSLLGMERWLFFGNDPAELLHSLLGTGVAANLLSAVYVAFFMFIPLSIGYALIWSDRLRTGVLYVSALSLSWLLGALSYYVIPAMGPAYTEPNAFADLPETAVSRLQDSLLLLRAEVLVDPATAPTVQSIAAFASLHTAILMVAVVVAELMPLPKPARIGLWIALILTLLSTVYFGWHYLVDDVAGAAIGLLAVWIGARLIGHDLNWRRGSTKSSPPQTSPSAT